MAIPDAMTLSDYRKKIIGKLALLENYEAEYKSVEAKMDKAKDNQRVYMQATQLLRDLYEQSQERFHKQIQEIVTYCLKEVFGEEAYEFQIKFAQKRNQVEAALVFVREGEEFNPLQAAGGGILSVACFALRLAVIYLTKRNVRSIMVLDEPFSQLSVEYRDRMAVLMNKLADQFDFQFILITHADEFEIGHIYRFDSDHNVKFVGENYIK